MTFADLGVPSSLAQPRAAGITTPTPIQAATLPDCSPAATCSAVAAPAPARRSPSASRWSPASPRRKRPAHAAQAARPHPGPDPRARGQIDAALEPLAKAAGLTTAHRLRRRRPEPAGPALRKGVDIVIACPGRLEDLMRPGHADLAAVEITVLDEADHMADLGFLPGVRRILDKTPQPGQRLLFSATLDAASTCWSSGT